MQITFDKYAYNFILFAVEMGIAGSYLRMGSLSNLIYFDWSNFHKYHVLIF